MRRFVATVLPAFAMCAAIAHEEPRYTSVRADRLEYEGDGADVVWDLQGWYGGDFDKLWWKTEGEYEHDATGELQLLYSRAATPYFDWQLGVRVEELDGGSETSLVLGWQGLAPYLYEIDTAAFLTADGDLLLRGEFDRDFLMTQSLVLQPRLELDAALQDVPERGIASGFTEIDVGLRLRYEFTRKFAPYIGVSWQSALGDTGDEVEAAGGERSHTTVLLGVHFWF